MYVYIYIYIGGALEVRTMLWVYSTRLTMDTRKGRLLLFSLTPLA